MLLLFSHEQIAMQKAGTRILMIVEPVEVLERLFPSTELRRRVEAAQHQPAEHELLDDGSGDGSYRCQQGLRSSRFCDTGEPDRHGEAAGQWRGNLREGR